MDRLRRNITAFISVLAALAAMLLVATTALAGPPPRSEAAPVSMSSDAPCGSGKAACSIDCAVLCHVLVVPSPVISKPMGRAPVAYSVRHATLRSLPPEAEDPPPR